MKCLGLQVICHQRESPPHATPPASLPCHVTSACPPPMLRQRHCHAMSVTTARPRERVQSLILTLTIALTLGAQPTMGPRGHGRCLDPVRGPGLHASQTLTRAQCTGVCPVHSAWCPARRSRPSGSPLHPATMIILWLPAHPPMARHP